jgi:hypothetical protein
VESVRRGDLDLAVILATTPDAPGTRVGSMKLRWLADEGLTDETLNAAGADRYPNAGYATLPLVALEEPCAIRGRALDLLGAADSARPWWPSPRRSRAYCPRSAPGWASRCYL